MSKIAELEKLFVEWEKVQDAESDESFKKTSNGEYIEKDFFERDGIIDEASFEKEKQKVLFISAEANADEYNAKKGIKKTDYRQAYLNYYENKHDDWRGKMKERLSAIYGYLTNQKTKQYYELANKFAVMDLNKRGGKATIDGGNHIVEYVRLYKDFINKEIRIIDPDIVVIVGVNLCRLRIVQELGCIEEIDKNYFQIGDKKVPILLSFQTSYFQSKIAPLPEYSDKTIGKLCAKIKLEMEKYGLM